MSSEAVTSSEGSKQRPKRYALAIELTSFCNQKCGYCYNDWRGDGGSSLGSLPSEKLLGLVDKALTEVEFDHVTLTGGEPLARHDFFEVLDVCAKHKVGVQIISNGGLVTEAIAERLAKYDLRFIQVTLNGVTRELHDEHVGPGHYDKTLKGIELLSKHKVPVVGCVVVTRKNAPVLGDVLAKFRELGVHTVALSRYSPAGYAARNVAELLPSRGEMVAALRVAEHAATEHRMDLQVTMPVPQCVVEHSEFPHVRFGGCPIGAPEAQEFALGPKGELRNCTLHSDAIGDGATQSFAELVESPAVYAYRDVAPAFCEGCRYRSSCLGGCGAAAISTLGARELDPFVAQHVDDVFRAKLKAARSTGDGFVPANRLTRRASA